MSKGLLFPLVVTMAALVLPEIASATSKAELIEAVAASSKLTKADAGRVLEAFGNAAGKALKKGDRLSLVGFGSFSVSKRTASANGCDSEIEIDFSPSVSFTAKKEEGGRHTPFHNKIARIVPQSDGTIQVFGPNNGELVRVGDVVEVYARDPQSTTPVATGVIVALLNARNAANFNPMIGEGFESLGTSLAGVTISGISRSDLQLGGTLKTVLPVLEDDPIGACPAGGYEGGILTDKDLFEAMLSETRLPQENLALAYAALLNIIIDDVNAGQVVDLGEGFGTFVEQSTVSASVADEPCAGLPENCPPTTTQFQVDVAVETGAVSAAELQRLQETVESLAKRAARTGRNPQTGKEIKIAAKKVVKFKAGAELAGKVN